jgi:tagatose-6-phosphate ketose/aldose isomerase
MKYLGIGAEELISLGAIHTAREIQQQPDVWRKIYNDMLSQKAAIQDFFKKSSDIERIILTGAGTSAFIGISLRGSYQRSRNIVTEAIPTTDLITHPRDFYDPKVPTLIVSFARSGNSPESVAALEFADAICEKCYHLIITCNENGLLAKYNGKNPSYKFLLPKESNDESLAMTSSYSGMLLAGRLLASIDTVESLGADAETIAKYAEKVLSSDIDTLRGIANIDFKRAVFLGSGPFLGTATEGHLKLQELSDGQIICKNDSFLGFRHGPKAVVDNSTLVFYTFSNKPYSQQYELDLVHAMETGNHPLVQVGVSESPVQGIKLDHAITLSTGSESVNEDLLSIASIVPAQILAFYKSLQLGLKPDAPSVSGAISRVVQGVKIYELEK